MPRQASAPAVRAADNNAHDVQLETRGQEVHLSIGTRRYRVRGLEKNLSLQQLRINLLAARDKLVHLDTFDLYSAKARAAFLKAAASELYVEEAVLKQDLGRLLLELERLQQDQIAAATQPRTVAVELTVAERQAALEFLQDSQLLQRILADYERCGLVGEETNKLVCYLACVSRQLAQPLAVLIQSSSAAGKTSLMDATLAFMPAEDQFRYSALTGQSLYYMGRQDLRHKILAVCEEEGVAQASYALKLLQSDGRLRIAATGKHPGTGRQQTESYEVEGPVMMFLTTTAEAPDAELQSRCLTLHVNESPQQTAAIHGRQRAAYTREGQAAESERARLTALHQHAQRLLQAFPVVIPWAEQLTFRHDQTRMRREHAQYLALIAASTLLHQQQRGRRALSGAAAGESPPVEYLEATRDDVALANRLAAEVLGQSLQSLLPQTRELLQLIDEFVTQQAGHEQKPRALVRFTQRGLREALAWGDFQLRRHLARLVELEYVLEHRTGQGNQRQYELLYDGQGRGGQRFLLGLIAAEQLATPPPNGRFDHSPDRIDHLPDRIDAHSMPLRSATDAPSMPPAAGPEPLRRQQLASPPGKSAAPKVKR